MSRRDDQYDDLNNGYNERYDDRNQDNYDGRFNDGYGSYSNGGYSDYDSNNSNYGDDLDDGYTDQYGNRYGGDRVSDDYADDAYQDDGYDDRYREESYEGGDGYQEDAPGRGYTDEDGIEFDDVDGYGEEEGYDQYRENNRRPETYDDDRYDEDSYADEDGYDDGIFDDDDADVAVTRARGRRAGRGGRGAGAQVSTRVGGNGGRKPGNKKRIILLLVELAALLVVVFVLYAVTRVEKVGKADVNEEDIEENIDASVKDNQTMKGYRNIALFGVDSTEGQLDQKTRSDTIMIASINQDTGDVKLISVYRDTLLDLKGGDYNKCNASYAKGGPVQAINMLNTNLDMNITDFVTVGFGGLTDVVNALGGIEINVDQDEIVHLNNYQSTMAQELGMDYTEVTESGMQTLDGLQATAYCRIRYTSGWDYKRAARQREVLYAVFNKAKQANPAALSEIVNNVFGEIYTSMDLSEMAEDISALASYNVIEEDNTDEMQNGFPQEEARIQANLGNALGDCVVPRSLSNNVIWLHQFLFNDTGYQPSSKVQEISDTIDEMTKDAVPEQMTDADHT